VPQKSSVDLLGVALLVLFAALMGLNQVVIKVVNAGFQPVFAAGLRSVGAIVCIGLLLVVQRSRIEVQRAHFLPGLGIGLAFGVEFLCLFIALDLSSVSRVSVIFYSMPVWLAAMAHVLLPGERLTTVKLAGLLSAFAGVAWALLARGEDAGGSFLGDLLALTAAFCWAVIVLISRGTALKTAQPKVQLMWQVVVSACLLLLVSPAFGPLVRDLQPIHIWGLGFQIVVIATFAFVLWFWLLSVYPASSVASFGFLSPVFGVAFGWLLLGESVGPGLLGALVLVAFGLWLSNRPAPSQPVGSGNTGD